MKLKMITFVLVLSLIMTCFAVPACAATKTASASKTYNSWCGIPVFTIGVKGDYNTNGKTLSNWKNARCANSTHYPGWSCTYKKAKWAVKGAKSSTVRNNSTFFYGLDTQWIKIGIQSYDKEINKTVKP